METPKMVEEQGPIYEIIPEAKQKEAVDWLNKQLFTTPTWLINQDIFDRTGLSGLTVIGGLQDGVLNNIISTRTFNKLSDAEAAMGNNAYQIIELLNDLKKGIWSELAAKKAIDIYRRNLQKSYVTTLIGLLGSSSQTVTVGNFSVTSSTGTDKSDIKSVVRAHLAQLRSEINAGATAIPDPMTRYHLQDLSKRIDNALDPK